IWRNLRTGEVLTRPIRRHGQPVILDPVTPLEPGVVSPGGVRPVPIVNPPTLPSDSPAALGLPPPVLVKDPKELTPIAIRSVAYFRPELGESITTALQKNVQQMAKQIVAMMEKPW